MLPLYDIILEKTRTISSPLNLTPDLMFEFSHRSA